MFSSCSICLPFYLSIHLLIYLQYVSICLSMCLSFSLSIYLQYLQYLPEKKGGERSVSVGTKVKACWSLTKESSCLSTSIPNTILHPSSLREESNKQPLVNHSHLYAHNTSWYKTFNYAFGWLSWKHLSIYPCIFRESTSPTCLDNIFASMVYSRIPRLQILVEDTLNALQCSINLQVGR